MIQITNQRTRGLTQIDNFCLFNGHRNLKNFMLQLRIGFTPWGKFFNKYNNNSNTYVFFD